MYWFYAWPIIKWGIIILHFNPIDKKECSFEHSFVIISNTLFISSQKDNHFWGSSFKINPIYLNYNHFLNSNYFLFSWFLGNLPNFSYSLWSSSSSSSVKSSISTIRLLALSWAEINSLSFICMALESLFCAFWIRKTMRNVTMVVPVLITICHTSENLNTGPVAAQIITKILAPIKAPGLPAKQAAQSANLSKKFFFILINYR